MSLLCVGLVGNRPVISPMERFASPPSLSPNPSLPFPRETRRGTTFRIRVAHRGWAPLALIITTRGTRSLSWDNALSPLDGGSAPPRLLSARLLLFLADEI